MAATQRSRGEKPGKVGRVRTEGYRTPVKIFYQFSRVTRSHSRMLSGGRTQGGRVTVREQVSDVPGEWTRDQPLVGKLGP